MGKVDSLIIRIVSSSALGWLSKELIENGFEVVASRYNAMQYQPKIYLPTEAMALSGRQARSDLH